MWHPDRVGCARILCVGLLSLGLSGMAYAAPITLQVTATIGDVSGTHAADLAVGQSIHGTFLFDTDELNASSARTTPSTQPGHEFTSFHEFSGEPYAVMLTIPAVGGSFANTAPVGVVVNDDLPLLASDMNG